MAARREHVLQAQPLREEQQVVEVVAGAAQVLGPDARLQAERVDRLQHAIALAVPAGRQPVVEREADAHLDEAARGVAVDRHQERQRPHQVRGQSPERLALAQRLAHEPEVEQLEVAQAAVDELGGARGGGGGEIALLDQRDRQPAQRQVARGAGAGHAAADDDDVVLGVGQGPGPRRAGLSRQARSASRTAPDAGRPAVQSSFISYSGAWCGCGRAVRGRDADAEVAARARVQEQAHVVAGHHGGPSLSAAAPSSAVAHARTNSVSRAWLTTAGQPSPWKLSVALVR